MYNAFSKVYDTMQYDIDYPFWYKSLTHYINTYGNQGNRILELACGTATLAIMFSRAGYLVDGLDSSAEMLSRARDKAQKSGQMIPFIHTDIQSMALESTYDVIFSMCDGFNYILTEAELLASFKNVHKHLNKDGLFIFDLSTLYKLEHVIGSETFAETFEDAAYIWENDYDHSLQRLHFMLTIFIKENDLQGYTRYEEFHEQTSYSRGQLEALLGDYFDIIDIVDGDTFMTLTSQSQRLCVVAKVK